MKLKSIIVNVSIITSLFVISFYVYDRVLVEVFNAPLLSPYQYFFLLLWVYVIGNILTDLICVSLANACDFMRNFLISNTLFQ